MCLWWRLGCVSSGGRGSDLLGYIGGVLRELCHMEMLPFACIEKEV